MPKVVDHDRRREEIALKAAEVFLESGYKSTGMRQLCEKLGMSKSAVYHYYKSKDELFRAATEALVGFDANVLKGRPEREHATYEQRLENFVLIFNQIGPRFFLEMKLVFDYIDVIGEQNVATDPNMLIANRNYMSLLEKYVSKVHQQSLFTLLLGLLNHQVLSGIALDEQYVVEQVSGILAL